jgi:hypothetical protein
VKSFALNTPAGRRWIETRFLTKQDGEWYGYSYAWNDEQTDAALLDRGGLDREFTVRDVAGERKQKWHYPSRAECMVCHSRAANFVLGLSELQMNKEHDYGGVRDNQLRVLEHLGLLQVNAFQETKDALRDEAKEKGWSEKQINDYMTKQTATRMQREPPGSGSMLSFTPDHYRKLVDPADARKDLNLRARSYLHANCSQCHVEAGGGNAQMELEFTTELAKMRIVDVKPVHHSFGLDDAKLVASGHPERSALLHRIAHRGEGHMPPLATSVVDAEAHALMREWIARMKK